MSHFDENVESQRTQTSSANSCEPSFQNGEYERRFKENSRDLKSLAFQVGGHRQERGSNTDKPMQGMYDPGNGTVLKTLQPPPRGLRELKFYEEVFTQDSIDQDILELRHLIPRFYGTEETGERTFLKLSNLTANYTKPCIADIKMGRITYDQEATLEKKLSEDSKYPPVKELGFQFVGVMIYDKDEPVHLGKHFCRSLTKDNIISKGFGRFFSFLGEQKRNKAIQQLLTQLQRIEAWFLRQKKYSFIASSLLIVYEGSNLPLKQRSHVDTSSTSDRFFQHPETSNNACYKTLPYESSGFHSEESGFAFNNKVCGCVIPRKEFDSSNMNVPKRSLDIEESSSVKCKKRKSDVDLYINSHSSKECNSTNYDAIVSDNEPFLSVHLIDFAHTFPADDIDQNVLFGVQKLIHLLQPFLRQVKNYETGV